MANHGQQILEFATAVVMHACAVTDAAKVKPHCRPAALRESTRQGLDHLVVQGTAKKRVRVGDDHHTLGGRCWRVLRYFYQTNWALNS